MSTPLLVSGAFFVAWYIALRGIGQALVYLFRIHMRYFEIPVVSISVSMVLLSVLAAIANFFLPISAALRISVLAIGLALAAGAFLRSEALNPRNDVLEVMIVLSVCILVHGPVFHYDTGLYHLQAIKWVQIGAIPRGLANLHGRFGFNSFWHPISALVQAPRSLTQYLRFPANGLLLAAMLATSIRALSGGRDSNTHRPLSRFLIGLIPLSYLVTRPEDVTGISTDFAAMTFVLLSAYFFLSLSESHSPERSMSSGMLMTLSAVFAVMIKLSSAVWAFALLVFAFGTIRRLSKRMLLLLATVVTVSAGLYMIRGYWLSGYPAYPSSLLGLSDAVWSVPTWERELESAIIRGWARSPNTDWENALSGWHWLGSWFQVYRSELVPIAVFYAAALIGTTLVKRRLNTPLFEQSFSLGLLWASFFALVFWFFTAPAPRFALPYFYLPGLLFLSHTAYEVYGIPREESRAAESKSVHAVESRLRLQFVAMLILATTLFGSLYSARVFRLYKTGGPDGWFADVPAVGLEICEVDNQQTVWVPANSDSGQVWDASLPAAPSCRKDLRLILDDDGLFTEIQAGIR